MAEEEWQHLYENFETTDLLSAVDGVDCLQNDLNDGEGRARPPELRTKYGLSISWTARDWKH